MNDNTDDEKFSSNTTTSPTTTIDDTTTKAATTTTCIIDCSLLKIDELTKQKQQKPTKVLVAAAAAAAAYDDDDDDVVVDDSIAIVTTTMTEKKKMIATVNNNTKEKETVKQQLVNNNNNNNTLQCPLIKFDYDDNDGSCNNNNDTEVVTAAITAAGEEPLTTTTTTELYTTTNNNAPGGEENDNNTFECPLIKFDNESCNNNNNNNNNTKTTTTTTTMAVEEEAAAAETTTTTACANSNNSNEIDNNNKNEEQQMIMETTTNTTTTTLDFHNQQTEQRMMIDQEKEEEEAVQDNNNMTTNNNNDDENENDESPAEQMMIDNNNNNNTKTTITEKREVPVETESSESSNNNNNINNNASNITGTSTLESSITTTSVIANKMTTGTSSVDVEDVVLSEQPSSRNCTNINDSNDDDNNSYANTQQQMQEEEQLNKEEEEEMTSTRKTKTSTSKNKSNNNNNKNNIECPLVIIEPPVVVIKPKAVNTTTTTATPAMLTADDDEPMITTNTDDNNNNIPQEAEEEATKTEDNKINVTITTTTTTTKNDVDDLDIVHDYSGTSASPTAVVTAKPIITTDTDNKEILKEIIVKTEAVVEDNVIETTNNHAVNDTAPTMGTNSILQEEVAAKNDNKVSKATTDVQDNNNDNSNTCVFEVDDKTIVQTNHDVNDSNDIVHDGNIDTAEPMNIDNDMPQKEEAIEADDKAKATTPNDVVDQTNPTAALMAEPMTMDTDMLQKEATEAEEKTALKTNHDVNNINDTIVHNGNNVNDNAFSVINLLHDLNDILQRNDNDENNIQLKLYEWCKQEDSKNDAGVRLIDGKRYEIFVKATDKPILAFEYLCREIIKKYENDNTKYSFSTVDEMKDAIINYAIQQAKRDKRIANDDYIFNNFSIIVTYGKVNGQCPHIDLTSPNYQFGLIITDDTLPTIIYQSTTTITESNIVTFLKSIYNDIPNNLIELIQNDTYALSLLTKFGNVLCTYKPYPQTKCTMENIDDILLKTGSVMCLPGGYVHAGPPLNDFRAILFFSAHPNNNSNTNNNNNTDDKAGSNNNTDNNDNTMIAESQPYDPDVQYNAPFLCCDLTRSLWDKCDIHNRVYLLNMIAKAIYKTRNLSTFRHLYHYTIFQKFVRDICYHNFPTGQRTEFLYDFALSTPYLDVDYTICNKLLSVPTLIDAKTNNPIAIYQYSKNNKHIIIYHPHENDNNKAYEGIDKYYTLEMFDDNGNNEALFDGTNGIIRKPIDVQFGVASDAPTNTNTNVDLLTHQQRNDDDNNNKIMLHDDNVNNRKRKRKKQRRITLPTKPKKSSSTTTQLEAKLSMPRMNKKRRIKEHQNQYEYENDDKKTTNNIGMNLNGRGSLRLLAKQLQDRDTVTQNFENHEAWDTDNDDSGEEKYHSTNNGIKRRGRKRKNIGSHVTASKTTLSVSDSSSSSFYEAQDFESLQQDYPSASTINETLMEKSTLTSLSPIDILWWFKCYGYKSMESMVRNVRCTIRHVIDYQCLFLNKHVENLPNDQKEFYKYIHINVHKKLVQLYGYSIMKTKFNSAFTLKLFLRSKQCDHTLLPDKEYLGKSVLETKKYKLRYKNELEASHNEYWENKGGKEENSAKTKDRRLSSSSTFGAQDSEPLKNGLPSASMINEMLMEESLLTGLSPIDIMWWFKCYGYTNVDSMNYNIKSNIRYIIDYQCLFLNKHVENLPNDQEKFYEYIRTNVHVKLEQLYGPVMKRKLNSAFTLKVFLRSNECDHTLLPDKEYLGESVLETDNYKLRSKNELTSSHNDYWQNKATKNSRTTVESNLSPSFTRKAQELDPLQQGLPSADTINETLMEDSKVTGLSPIDIMWWFKCYGYEDIDLMQQTLRSTVRYVIDYQCLFLNEHVEDLPNDQEKFYKYIRTNIHEKIVQLYPKMKANLRRAYMFRTFFRSEECDHAILPDKEYLGKSVLETDKFKLRCKNELASSHNDHWQNKGKKAKNSVATKNRGTTVENNLYSSSTCEAQHLEPLEGSLPAATTINKTLVKESSIAGLTPIDIMWWFKCYGYKNIDAMESKIKSDVRYLIDYYCLFLNDNVENLPNNQEKFYEYIRINVNDKLVQLYGSAMKRKLGKAFMVRTFFRSDQCDHTVLPEKEYIGTSVLETDKCKLRGKNELVASYYNYWQKKGEKAKNSSTRNDRGTTVETDWPSPSTFGAQYSEALQQGLPSAEKINEALTGRSSLNVISPIDIMWWFKCYGYKDIDSMDYKLKSDIRYVVDYHCLFLNEHVENLPSNQEKFYEYIRTTVHVQLVQLFGSIINRKFDEAFMLLTFFRSDQCDHALLPDKEYIGPSVLETDKYKLRLKNELASSHNFYFQSKAKSKSTRGRTTTLNTVSPWSSNCGTQNLEPLPLEFPSADTINDIIMHRSTLTGLSPIDVMWWFKCYGYKDMYSMENGTRIHVRYIIDYHCLFLNDHVENLPNDRVEFYEYIRTNVHDKLVQLYGYSTMKTQFNTAMKLRSFFRSEQCNHTLLPDKESHGTSVLETDEFKIRGKIELASSFNDYWQNKGRKKKKAKTSAATKACHKTEDTVLSTSLSACGAQDLEPQQQCPLSATIANESLMEESSIRGLSPTDVMWWFKWYGYKKIGLMKQALRCQIRHIIDYQCLFIEEPVENLPNDEKEFREYIRSNVHEKLLQFYGPVMKAKSTTANMFCVLLRSEGFNHALLPEKEYLDKSVLETDKYRLRGKTELESSHFNYWQTKRSKR